MTRIFAAVLLILAFVVPARSAELVDPHAWGYVSDPHNPIINQPLSGGILRAGWTSDAPVELRAYLSFDVSQITPGAANYFVNVVSYGPIPDAIMGNYDLSMYAYSDDGAMTAEDFDYGDWVGAYSFPTTGLVSIDVTDVVTTATTNAWSYIAFKFAPGWTEPLFAFQYGYPGWDGFHSASLDTMTAMAAEPNYTDLSTYARYDVLEGTIPEPASVALLAVGTLLLRRRQ